MNYIVFNSSLHQRSRSVVILLCIVLTFMCVNIASSAALFSETFESAALDTVPPPWSLLSATGVSGKVVSGYTSNTTKAFQLYDDNATTVNGTLYTTFPELTSGLCVLKFDVCMANIHAGFGVRITNGLSPNGSANWGAAIRFEGDSPYAANAQAGTISYQQYASLLTPNAYVSATPTVNFQGGDWYTVKIEANIDTKIYHIYYGPRGGSLARITPESGVQFIRGSTGAQIGSMAGIMFFSSQRIEPAGQMYIDNVSVTNGAEVLNTIAEVKQKLAGTVVDMEDKVATAGTDQMGKPFFYIQDETGGIRVRTSVIVRQGDKVTISGPVRRASDNGTLVARNGEREIDATYITVTYGPFPMPKLMGMANKYMGGGPFGPVDTDGYPCQPGVWAKSTGATSGYDQISEAGLNNVGKLCRVWGKVVYADDANRFFYINDGSDVQDGSAVSGGFPSPKGVRILVPAGVPLTNIVGKYATITGVVGSVSQADAGSPQGTGGNYIRNVRVIRPTCEAFLDLNNNGFRDAGEAFVDATGNGAYDGIHIGGTMPAPSLNSFFDRYGTAICRGRPFMIKGIYIYDLADSTLDEMVRQGFNTIIDFDAMVPSHMSYLNMWGLKTMPCLRDPAMHSAWMSVKNEPAVLGWYLYDEPEGHGYSPAQAITDFNWVKAQDPSHFIGESHFIYEAYANYAASDEFAISDRYPIGNAPLRQVGDFIGMTKSVHGSIYFPAWPFVQTFQEAPNFVLPSPEQVRAMTYSGLANYAKGVLYFSYQRPNHPYWPLNWAEIKKMNGEMDMLSPFLTLPWVPVDLTNSNPNIVVGGFRVGGSAIIFTVNVEGSNQTTTITLPGIGAESLTLPLEGGAIQPLTNRAFTYTYAPLQVRVLMWGDIPPAP